MSLDLAANRLARIAHKPLRNYSTFDFGRQQDDTARSIVIAEDLARQVLQSVRSHLAPGVVAFIGTSLRLGAEQHNSSVEIVVANGVSQFDILRVARTDAANFGIGTEDLVNKLQSYHEAFGIDIFRAESDMIEFRLSRLPDPLSEFCVDLYEFCPDIVDQGVESLENLEDAIRSLHGVYLWWD